MHSIILNIHNGARLTRTGEVLLHKVLNGIVTNTVGEYEILCMLDGCSDNSALIVDQYRDRANIQSIVLPNVHETKSNNAGLKGSKGEYAIIFQDDQVVTEYGWNLRMQRPFDVFSDVFAVTTRCAHNWVYNENSFYLNNPDAPQNDWCDILDHVDHASKDHGQPRNIFAVRSTVNRGPLMINLDDLKKLNYLDEVYAPLENDEHDLMYRAYKELNKICGSYLVGMESRPEWSGSMKGGPPPLWRLSAQHKNTKILYDRHKDIINTRRIIENRELFYEN